MIAYKTLSVMAASLCIVLAIFLLLIPEPIFLIFGVAGNESAYFISRRASMFFVGYAAIAFLSRHEPPSASRQSISFGIGTSMAGFGALGLFELVRGFAGPGILLPMVVEFYLALSYFTIWSRDKRGKRSGSDNVAVDQSETA
jgi:hypothetical protein